MNKKGLEMSFQWIFAIVVGIAILLLAVYATIRFMGLGEQATSVVVSKEIGILLNPLETSFESAKKTSFALPSNTRIYNGCDNSGVFGKQKISVSQESFGKWPETDVNAVSFQNKYIFSEDPIEGKKFYIFSKPFKFPFKIADLVYLTSSKYCFINAPEEIAEELNSTALSQENLLTENCKDLEDAIKVCFGSGSDCDVKVNYNEEDKNGYVEKADEKINFETDALMYAAIFSKPAVYECHTKRLMQRGLVLALLYKSKASFTECGSNLKNDLSSLKTQMESFDNSGSLRFIAELAKDIENKNENNRVCRLW